MEIWIRQATPEAADAIADVHVASIRSAYRAIFPEASLAAIDQRDRAERWRRGLAAGPDTTLLAESVDQLLGFVNYGPCRDEDVEAGRVGEIMAIYVAPGSWRKGIGRRLLRAARERLANAGFREAKVWVLDRNAQAIAFYERAGFVPDGRIKHREMYGVPTTIFRYSARLVGDLV
jgi:ribosomal protein S18 acetylase RimI-like enzyme